MGAGDVNGNGYDDVLIGGPGANDNGRNDSGSVYVLLGGSTADVDLAALGSRGFRIDRDGSSDVLIGVREEDGNGRNDSGSSYVLLGGGTGSVDLADLGDRGFGIDGAVCEDLQVRNLAPGNATTASMISERLQDAVAPLRQRNGDTDPGNDVVAAVTVGGLSGFQPILTAFTEAL